MTPVTIYPTTPFSCATREVIPMVVLQWSSLIPRACQWERGMLWHASAAHLWSLPCRAWRMKTKQNSGGKQQGLTENFQWLVVDVKTTALHYAHSANAAHTGSHCPLHISDTVMTLHLLLHLPKCFTEKSFLNCSVLTVGNPAFHPAPPLTRYSLFDY